MHEVVGACPLDCPDACAWVVTVDGGRPVRLRASREHPFTRGSLCVKTNSYLDHLAHPDRLLHPLRRVGVKGEGRFERITWEEALDEIAERITAAVERHGSETIWPFAGTGTVGWLQGPAGAGRRLWHHLGASRHAVTICSVAGHVGMSYTCGSAAGMDPEDLVHAGIILVWGANPFVSNRHLVPVLGEARRRGATVWCIDPRRTATAEWSDRHLAPLPGSDGALALGVMAELVRRGAHDTAFLEERCSGWPEFAASLAAWTPERTAATCGLTPGEVTDLAAAVAERRPLAVRISMGLQRHAGGGQAARVISCLPAVTGDHGRLGGGIVYSTGPAYTLDEAALARPDLLPGPVRSLAMTRLGEGLCDLDDPPVTVLVVTGANPVVSNPDTGRVRAGLARPDLFTVVVEHFLTDTAAFADIVLPSTMQPEHTDLHDSFSHLYLQWNEAALPPRGECLSHTEIFRRLARRLGIDHPAVLASDLELAREVLAAGPTTRTIDLEELRARGWARLDLPRPWLPFAARFPTPSGRFEFVSPRAEADGHGRLPHYVAPAEATSAGPDELALVAPAATHFLNSTFANRRFHRSRVGEPTVTLHPDDAARLGIGDGERVRVANARGAFEATARVADTVRPGVVAGTKGHWSGPDGPGVNAVVAERDADMGRGGVFHDTRVRVIPLGTAVGGEVEPERGRVLSTP